MNIEEKRNRLQMICDEMENCYKCPLGKFSDNSDCDFDRYSAECIGEAYKIAFGDERIGKCEDCKYYDLDGEFYPCKECNHNGGIKNCFEPIDNSNSDTVQREEINHPDRYAGGKFECIDVMQDVFGADAVKHFCILNAFKYIWRAEKKNGIEDIKKAVWYLNKYIELGAESSSD